MTPLTVIPIIIIIFIIIVIFIRIGIVIVIIRDVLCDHLRVMSVVVGCYFYVNFYRVVVRLFIWMF